MIAIFLFVIAVAATLIHYAFKRSEAAKIFLGYIILLNMGVMGLIAGYAHIFMGPEIARQIGWQPGSPFQFEIGVANLSYGVLGILAFILRGKTWFASVVAWSVFLIGAFIGHIHNYIATGNSAPLNIGIYVWFNDLLLPVLALTLLAYRKK